MAKELAVYIREQLEKLPRNHRDRAYLRRTLTQTETYLKDIETIGAGNLSLGNRINLSFGANLEDYTLLTDIGMPTFSNESQYSIPEDQRKRWKGMPLWEKILETSSSMETGKVSKALIQLGMIGRFSTVGELRDALLQPMYLPRLSEGSRNLLFEAFKKPESQTPAGE